MKSLTRWVKRSMFTFLHKSFNVLVIFAFILQPFGATGFNVKVLAADETTAVTTSAVDVPAEPVTPKEETVAPVEEKIVTPPKEEVAPIEPVVVTAETEAVVPAVEETVPVDTTKPEVTPVTPEIPTLEEQPIDGAITPEAAAVSSETPAQPKEIWATDGNKSVTNDPVERGKIYVAPQDDQVTVTFTKLPENPGMLSIEEITLTPEQVASLGAISNKAYDITSDMADGTFSYELTLPKAKDTKDVQIKFAEDLAGLENAEIIPSDDVKMEKNSVNTKLDHFTIFVVSGLTASPLCTGASISTQSGDTCYLTIQAAVDAASANDTINVSAGDYTENLTINKSVTLKGPNVGVAGNGTRVLEARILNSTISFNGSNTITMDGFYIYTTTDAQDAVMINADTAVTLTNSKIERRGVTTGNIVRAITTAIGSTAPVYITNNLFTGDISGGLYSGHKTWNSAIYSNGGTNIIITGNVFENSRTALNLDNFSIGVTVSGNTFKNSGTYISFGGTTPTDGQYTISGNNFETAVDTIFNLSNVTDAFRIDATGNTFLGKATGNLTLADSFIIEAGMYHRGRTTSKKGLVTYVAGKQFVITANPSIQRAIDKATSGDTINVAMGTYHEQVIIDKAVSVLSAGAATTFIDGTGVTPVLPGLVNITNETGAVTLDGFTIRNAPALGGTRITIWAKQADEGSVYSSSMTITHNILVGNGHLVPYDDYGLYSMYNKSNLVFSYNDVNNFGGNALLLELHTGPAEISHNNITVELGGPTAIFSMSYKDGYNNNDVTGKQWLHDNTINANGGSAIVMASAFGAAGYNELTNGKYTNVEITDNVITNVGDAKKGIQLEVDGDNGGFVNPLITGNTISAQNPSPGPGLSRGIRIMGVVTGAQILDNDITGFYRGIYQSDSFSHLVYPTNTQISTNVITGGTYGIDIAGGTATAHRNNVSGNTAAGIKNLLTTLIADGTCNWWGAANGPGPVGPGSGSPVTTNVTFSPWLTSSDLNGPCNGPLPVTVITKKVVCDSEAALPNGAGNLGGSIGASTAQDFVTASNGHCSLVNDWNFQWSSPGAGTFGPFQTDTSSLGSPWTTIPVGTNLIPSASVSGHIEMREVFPNSDYVPFTNSGNVSAEIYCTGDAANYDNWEWLNNPISGSTFYCVGFNAFKPGTLTVNKVLLPSDDSGKFDLKIDGTTFATNVGDTGTTGSQSVVAGNHVVSEAGNNTNLSDYTSVISGDCAANGNVTVGPNQNKTCTITNTKKGTIEVRKVISPSDSSYWNFGIDAGYTLWDTWKTDGYSSGQVGVVPGSHSVVEQTAPGTDGTKYFSSLECKDGDAIVVTAGPASLIYGQNFASPDFNIASGHHIVCTFTNTKAGTIEIKKVISPSDSSYWNFGIDAGYTLWDTWKTDGYSSGQVGVVPGSHSVVEQTAPGTDGTQYSSTFICKDGNTIVATGGPASLPYGENLASSEFNVASDQHIVCTFINTKKGHIVIDKVIDPSGDTQSFNFTAGGVGYSNFSLTDTDTPNNQEVVPGTYSVAENVPVGWDSDGGVCDLGETPGSLDVGPGETVTCTFTNTKQVTVTVLKYVDGILATPESVSNTSFPMTATWNAANIGSGSGGFALDADGFNGDPTPYQAITSQMTNGADYSVVENIPTTCTTNAYKLVGYSTGGTLSSAEGAATIATASLTGITSNKFIIVRNETCVAPIAPTLLGWNAKSEARGLESDSISLACLPGGVSINDSRNSLNQRWTSVPGSNMKYIRRVSSNGGATWNVLSGMVFTTPSMNGWFSFGSGEEGTYDTEVMAFNDVNDNGLADDGPFSQSGWSNDCPITYDISAPTVTLDFPGIIPGASSFQAVFSEDVNASEAQDPANYFLINWPDAGGSGDLAGDATVTYNVGMKTATVQFNNPASFYVSPEQKWGVKNIHDLAGNLQNPSPKTETSTPMVAPVTTDSGTDANWHNTPVTVTLTCADPSVGSGCKTTYYTTDGSAPNMGSAQGNSVVVSADGVTTIKYFSVDNAGNTEAVKTAAYTVKIDKTIPEVVLTIDPANPNGDNGWYDTDAQITLTAADNFDVDRIEYQLNGTGDASWTLYTAPVTLNDGEWQFYYRSIDTASNTSAIGLKNVKVDTQDPDNVNNLDATYRQSPNRVQLTWSVGDSDIDSVYIYRGESKSFSVNMSSRIAKNNRNDTNYSDYNVIPGEKYYYKVVTIDNAGNKSNVDSISITLPTEGTQAEVTNEGTEVLPEGTVLGTETDNSNGGQAEGANGTGGDQSGQVLGAETSGSSDNGGGMPFWQWLLIILVAGGVGYYGYGAYRRNHNEPLQ